MLQAQLTHIDWNESNYFLNNNVYKWVSFLLLHYNFVFVTKNLDEDNYNMSNNFFMNFFSCFILLFICHKIILFHKTKQKKKPKNFKLFELIGGYFIVSCIYGLSNRHKRWSTWFYDQICIHFLVLKIWWDCTLGTAAIFLIKFYKSQ